MHLYMWPTVGGLIDRCTKECPALFATYYELGAMFWCWAHKNRLVNIFTVQLCTSFGWQCWALLLLCNMWRCLCVSCAWRMCTDALCHTESALLLPFASQTSIVKQGCWNRVCGIHGLRTVDNSCFSWSYGRGPCGYGYLFGFTGLV